jgi:hypothetical protein
VSALRTPTILVWLALVAATGLSFALGSGHTSGAGKAVISCVLAIAFIKAWLVGRWFMELRTAPRWLRSVFDAWVLVVGAALIGLYLSG